MIRFDGILTKDEDVAAEARACRKIARRLFELEIPEKEQPVSGFENMKETDLIQCEAHGRVCRLVSRGCKNEEGVTAYTEPCFIPRDDHGAKESGYLFVCTAGLCSDESRLIAEPETAEQYPQALCDNSIDIHPYYIRTKYKKGLWLDVVTVESWGEGVLTMPVSVKAMHNWAEHALREDPELFFAAVM